MRGAGGVLWGMPGPRWEPWQDGPHPGCGHGGRLAEGLAGELSAQLRDPGPGTRSVCRVLFVRAPPPPRPGTPGPYTRWGWGQSRGLSVRHQRRRSDPRTFRARHPHRPSRPLRPHAPPHPSPGDGSRRQAVTSDRAPLPARAPSSSRSVRGAVRGQAAARRGGNRGRKGPGEEGCMLRTGVQAGGTERERERSKQEGWEGGAAVCVPQDLGHRGVAVIRPGRAES